MLKNKGEVWSFRLIILINFLYNMLPQVVGNPFLPTIFKNFTCLPLELWTPLFIKEMTNLLSQNTLTYPS
jgi:hypothetical protein